MNEQYINDCLVYRVRDGKLKVGKAFRHLHPVFITREEYIQGIFVPDQLIPSKIVTSYFTSTLNPLKPDCEYFSWKQVSPQQDNGLSYVVGGNVPESGHEIIQLM